MAVRAEEEIEHEFAFFLVRECDPHIKPLHTDNQPIAVLIMHLCTNVVQYYATHFLSPATQGMITDPSDYDHYIYIFHPPSPYYVVFPTTKGAPTHHGTISFQVL